MKIITWNANGLAHLVSAVRKRRFRYLDTLARSAQVILIQ